MSSKNIFEVLQNVAENTESNEKFLNILKENGFTGTLEEAENQINQQTQVVLNNLTTEDLQNIAGGKSLMNDKLKKAIAVGGASLMAAGTVTPDSLAVTKNDAQKFATRTLKYVKENPVHTAVTGAFAVATILFSAKSAFGGKDKSGLTFTNPEASLLWDKDLSEGKNVLKFIEQLSNEECLFGLEDADGVTKIEFTATHGEVLKNILSATELKKQFTTETLLLTLIQEMDQNNTYVDKNHTLTSEGANVLNTLAPYMVEKINKEITTRLDKVNENKESALLAQGKVNDAAAALEKATEALKQATQREKEAQEEENKAEQEQKKEYTQKTASATAVKEEAQKNVEQAKAAKKQADDELNAINAKSNKASEIAEKIKCKSLILKRAKFKSGDSVQAENKTA